MDLILKIIAQGIALALGLVPSYFNLIKDDKTISYIQRITTWGKIAIGTMLVLFCIIWRNEVKDNAESDELRQNVVDIKTAVEKAGLKYDSTSNVITDINGSVILNNGGFIGATAGAGSNLRNFVFEGNSINNNSNNEGDNPRIGADFGDSADASNFVFRNLKVDASPNSFYKDLAYRIRKAAKEYNLPSNTVDLYYLSNTNGGKFISRIKQKMTEEKFIVNNKGKLDMETTNQLLSRTIAPNNVTFINLIDRMAIFVGNLPSDFMEAK